MDQPVTQHVHTGASNGAAPDSVTIYQEDIGRPRFTPRELDMVKERTGMTLSQIIMDDASDEKFTVFAWLKLRRSGFTLTWEQMRDVVIEVKVDVSATDPLSAPPLPTSPLSVATGE